MSDAKTISDREGECTERIRRLEAELAAQRKENERLRRKVCDQDKEIDGLKSALARATTCSSNSSKPPSSDIVKRQRPAPSGSRRKIGAQPGHPPHVRAPFKPEEIDAVVDHALACCPDCAGPLDCYPGAKKIVQQMDVQPLPVRVEEHRAGCYWCAKCKKQHIAPLPPHVEKGGLCGPYLTTLAAYLKGACHASFSTIRKFLRDVAGITISRGHLRNLIAKVSAAGRSVRGTVETVAAAKVLERRRNRTQGKR